MPIDIYILYLYFVVLDVCQKGDFLYDIFKSYANYF